MKRRERTLIRVRRSLCFDKMLRMQHAARGHAISPHRLAKRMGWANWNAANLHYGRLVHAVAKELGERHKWWFARIADYEHCAWVMRPDIVRAMDELEG